MLDVPAPALSDDEARWAAVLARDPAADGAFVLGVRTTGIYCRPTCPARRPKRENVAFYPDPAAARAAGLRACLRCEPDAEPERRVASQAVAAAAAMIEAAVADEAAVPGLDAIAARAGYAPHHFHRLFRRQTGLTPAAYARALRARRAEAGLAAGESVTQAIVGAGYGSPSRFYAEAGARLGMSPATRREGGRGETIRHATAATSLGTILVAATARGVCAVQFGEDEGALTAWLARRFPNATLAAPDPGFAALVADVAATVESPGEDRGLPLDLRGTAFQERVWQALRDIPCGTTTTYADLAAAIGRPGSARAVATACAANPVGVVVPCHRVVRTGGAISGYRWGVARKAALLARERTGG
ncbi:bifunctional DNA-binding transcriptional regulator/O6-methylguanine-DNA methyltransferase Ada [Amaricoccus sp.]|uniref:bifunctional DNA-binding transcriptional regulator/O6-methylguanine-DNA methyltransferase Ada n=1 Tax=Amaricoccus sp. TaxID=1872485 RepID=UPI001B3D700F|nr:bifunctional DNA-binding transcriptional regulator/O6-methylguanine-DNA methyltransferase Ada [Amaricoccus sp.]MBP7000734.1 bifunctional DNA-binding transcriptional regulator/O6-methylguanine-DNA methyltransferase Ada [Amaricoccus sp.]